MTKQDIQQQIDNIRQLIIEGETMKAIQMLLTFAPSFNIDKYRDAAINIRANKKQLIEEELQVITSSDDLAVRKSKINSQILGLLTLIENEQIEGETILDASPLTASVNNPPKKKSNSSIIAVICALIVIGLMYFVVFRGNGASKGLSPCDVSFEKGKLLFEKEEYAAARLEFLEMKIQPDCQNRLELINEYLDLCNSKEGGDEFKVYKLDINAAPQVYSGECPISVFFSGKIYTNQKSGRLDYCLNFTGGGGSNCLDIQIKDGIAEFARPFEFSEDFLNKTGEKVDVEVMIVVNRQVVYKSTPIPLTLKCLDNDEGEAMPQAAIQDKRDGRNYPFLRVGKDIWFAKNMTYKSTNAECIVNDCENQGRIYSSEDARKACPSGYVNASVKQFMSLKNTIGDFDKIVERLNIEPVRENKTAFWAYSQEAKTWKAVVFDFSSKNISVQSPAKSTKYFCRCVNLKLNLQLDAKVLKNIQTIPTINPNLLRNKDFKKPNN